MERGVNFKSLNVKKYKKKNKTNSINTKELVYKWKYI